MISLVLTIAILFISSACGTTINEKEVYHESDNDENIKQKAEFVLESDGTQEEIRDEIDDEPEDIVESKTEKEFETSNEANLIETISDEEKKEVNKFLSNFSEAFYGLNVDSIAEDKISFAYIHNCLNNDSFELVYKEFDGRVMDGISAELVDSTLIRFFGETVAHETPANSQWWEYRDGYFWSPAASGETYHRFSVAKNMYRNSDGTYTVEFRTYRDDEDPHGEQNPKWYTETVESTESNVNYVFLHNGTAILREKVYNGTDTYELVSYNLDKAN